MSDQLYIRTPDGEYIGPFETTFKARRHMKVYGPTDGQLSNLPIQTPGQHIESLKH